MLTEIFIKVSGKMEEHTDLEFFLIMMDPCTTVSGKTICSMERVKKFGIRDKLFTLVTS